MKRASAWLCRYTAVTALIFMFGGSSAALELAKVASSDEPAQAESSGDQPAQVIVLAGEPARQLAAYNPPPDYPVLVAGTQGNKGAIAFVFDESAEEAESLLEQLLVPGDVQDCVREGAIVCCDPETETFVLNTERGWLRLGERCKALPPKEGNTGDDPEPPAIQFDEISTELASALAQRGVGYPLMTLPKANGEPRVLEAPSLADAPSPNGELWLQSPTMLRSEFRRGLPIILAGHRNGAACPNNCCDTINYCRENDAGLRCSTARKHWYQFKSSRQQWCETTQCRCS